jgi:hypothetical protein
MPLLLQRHTLFIDSVIYLGVDMENRKLTQEMKKTSSKGRKSKCLEEQLEAYAKSTARAFQNGEVR